MTDKKVEVDASGCAVAVVHLAALALHASVSGCAAFVAWGWARGHWTYLPEMPFGVAVAAAWLWIVATIPVRRAQK